jgi:hypothetical protein
MSSRADNHFGPGCALNTVKLWEASKVMDFFNMVDLTKRIEFDKVIHSFARRVGIDD